MAGLYFILMIAMAFAAFIATRSRAARLAGTVALHSRPSYHGLLAALQIVLPMLAILFFGSIFATGFVEHQALTAMDPALVTDGLKRGAALEHRRAGRDVPVGV